MLSIFLLYEGLPAEAQEPSAAGGPAVNMVVTANARHGMNPAPVDRQDVMVYEGKARDAVTSVSGPGKR